MSHLRRACGRGSDSFIAFLESDYDLLESDYDLLALHSDPRFIALMRLRG